MLLPATCLAALAYDYNGPSVAVPDNSASGRAFAFSISQPENEIAGITVSLDISGGANGDLYAYLSHGAGFAVLLNRVGMGETTPGSSAGGYLDTGFALTFSSAASANVHFYQNQNPSINGSGQLTGLWQPDARNIDPGSTPFDFEAPGTACFESFIGLDPRGDWTLLVADMSPGAISTVNGFSIDITAVPEPTNVALSVFAILGIAFTILRGNRKQNGRM